MCDQISAWNGPWFAEWVEQYIVGRLESALDVNEDWKTIRTTTQRKPRKALYGVAARIIATGAIALPTVSFISRQHITRRRPLLVLRLVLVYWRGTVPLLVVATIGICVLMLTVSCLAMTVRTIVVLVGVLLMGRG